MAAMSRSDYRMLVKYGIPEQALSQKVMLVTIGSAEPADIKSDPCAQRLFVANLVERLKRLNVSVIALDKFYDAATCPPDGEATKALFAALSGTSPVTTLAQRTQIVPKRQRAHPQVCLRLRPGLTFGLPETNLGVARLDTDTRRIPLKWPLIVNGKNQPPSAESFAFVTARAANKAAVETPLLRRALRKTQQPYSTTVKIESYSALDILCGKNTTVAHWRECKRTEPVEGMNGAIVVIGDHIGEEDIHPAMRSAEDEDKETDEQVAAPEGLLYGVDLQANYIAALLDKRYYLPLLPEFWNSFVVVVFYIVLLCLFGWSKRRFLTVSAGIGVLISGLIGVFIWGLIVFASFEAMAHWHYILTVWVHGINLVSIVVLSLEHLVARMD